MNKENCALKLVDEIILYYDARSKKHRSEYCFRSPLLPQHSVHTTLGIQDILLPVYEACPDSKDTKVLNMYNIFNLKSDTVNKLSVHNFIFQHSRRHCPNIY